MQATFYNFAKRSNSTKFPPAGSETGTFEVTLKNGADIFHPVFLLAMNAEPVFNYLFWNIRDYFVTDIRSVRNGLWEIECAVDVLATYRQQIFNTTAFVLYDGSANTEVIDTRLPVKTTATHLTNYATVASNLMTGQWKIAVTVTGSDSTSTFLLTPAQVKALVNSTDFNNWFNGLWQSVQSDINSLEQTINSNIGDQQYIAMGIEDATDQLGVLRWGSRSVNLLVKALSNAITQSMKYSIGVGGKFLRRLIATPSATDCIKAATIIPWDVVGDGSATTIMLGEYNTGISALPVYNPIQHGQTAIAIPWQATDWRRNAPYHQIYLYLPFIGNIQLSPSDLIGQTTLTIYWSLNVVNGALNYRVAGTSGDITVGVYSANTGIPYAIGASNISPVSEFTSLAAGAGAIASAVSSGGLTVGAAAMAHASINALQPSISSVGGGGGGAGSGLDRRAIIHSIFHDTVVEPPTIQLTAGTPTGAVKTLSSLAGLYVQTANASVGIDDNTNGAKVMADWERQEINRLLDGGVYLE